MPFDPNLPFEEVDETDTLSFDTVSKPKATGFDFNQPFEEVEDTEDQSQFDADYFRPKPLRTEKEKQEIGTIEGITNAAKNAFDSSRQAMDVVGGVSPEEAQNIAKIEFNKKSRKLAPGYDEFQKAEGWDWVLAFAKNPIEVTSNLVAEGLAGSLPALGAGLAAGGVGAAIGAPTGIGAPIGFTAGQIAGTFAGSLATEYGSKVLEELQGEGMDISDPNSIQTFFGNEELMGKVRNKALTRGVPVAAFDAISAGIGGKLGRVFGTKAITEGGKIIGKQFATKTGEAATELGAQALAGGIGEASGSLAIGEPIEGKAVFGEVIGEVGPGSVEILTGRIADKRAMAKAQEDAKIKAAADLSTTLEENSSPLTASVVTAKSATNIEQDKLAAQLDEELSLAAVKPSVAAPVAIPTKDDYVARYSAIAQTAPEELTRAEQAFTNELATADTREKRVNAQNALDAIKEVKGVGLTPATQAVSPVTQEGQIDSTIFDLQSVANNTATREQISSLSLSGLVDIRKGQAIINEDGEGILAQAQAPLPTLTPEARAAEVEATTPRPLPTDVLPTETPGVEYGRESELFDVFGGVRRRPVTIEEPTIGEIPQTSPMIGEQPTEPIISEKPTTSDIVGAETPTIVEQEQLAPEVPAITPAPVEEAIPTAEALVPPNALENIKKNPDLYEAVKKDALSGYLVPAYISNSVSSRNLPKGFSQSLIAKVKKQVGDNPFIFEIEYAIKNEIEKTAYGKEKKKADEVKLDSALQRTGETYELDVAIQDYRNKQIELERTQKSILTTPALRQVERVGAKNNLEKSKQKLIAIAAKPAPVAETPAVTPAAEVAPAPAVTESKTQAQHTKDTFASIQQFLRGGGQVQIPGNPPRLIRDPEGITLRGYTIYTGTGKRAGAISFEDVRSLAAQVGNPISFESISYPQEAPAPARAIDPLLDDALHEQSWNRLAEMLGDNAKAAEEIELITGRDALDAPAVVVDLIADQVAISKGLDPRTPPKERMEQVNKLARDVFNSKTETSPERSNAIEYARIAASISEVNAMPYRGGQPKPFTPTPAVSEAPTAEPAGISEEVAPTPSPKEVSAIETPTTTNLRNKIKEAKGKDRQIVVMQAMADESFFSSAIEAAEFGKPFPSIGDTRVDDRLPDSIPETIDTSKIKLSPIKAKPPETAASPMISYDDNRWVLGGVYLDSTNNMVVATDGRALVAIPQKVTGGDKIVAERNIKKQGIKKGDLIEGNYPNWKQVVPTYGKDIQKVDIDIDDALKASTILDSINNTFNNKVGSSLIVFNDAKFDPKYILSSITALVESGAKSITAQIKSEADTLLLTGSNGAIAVVMPKRATGRITHTLKARSEIKMGATSKKVEKYDTQTLLNAAKPFSEYGANYNRNIAASYERLKGSIEKGSLESTIAYNAEELQIRLNKFEPEALANAMQEQVAPTSEPTGISVGSRIKLGKSPQTYTIEEVVPQSEVEKANNEQFYSVKNERTGEVQVVEKADMKQVGGKRARKMAAQIEGRAIVDADMGSRSQAELTPQEIDQLEKGRKIRVFRAMQIIDGKLYPPMSALVGGKLRNPTEIGTWEKAEERPDLLDKKGKFILQKGNKATVPAAYNPYFHTSSSPLNDQFSSAYKRDNLVTVEVEIPASELTSGYKAEGAKDAVGEVSWNAGPVSSKLPDGKKRKVFLSRYAKVVRIVPDSEVAGIISNLLQGTNLSIPENTVTPSLKSELEKKGVIVTPKPADIRRETVTIQQDEVVTPIPEANRYTFEEAVKAVDAHFGKQGIPEGVVIVNNTTEPDLEMKAGYFVNRGQIVINLAYIAKGENLGDIIDHELGHYIFGDPEFQDNFKSFWEAMTPEEQAEADRLINQFYNKETGAVQVEEKQVRAFLQLIQDSKAMPKWKQLLDSIKRWINEKLGTNLLVTDRNALAVLAAAHKRFKSGEQIVREIDSGVLKSAETAQDAEYLAAVERGDMETAQRMVDEAAKRAGYDIEAYHGSDEWQNDKDDFVEFNQQYTAFGYYFAPDERAAEYYAPKGVVKKIYLKIPKLADFTNPQDFNKIAEEAIWETDPQALADEISKAYDAHEAGGSNWYMDYQDDFVKTASNLGYDGVFMIDASSTGTPESYVIFDPQNAKLSLPVTYDDEGNVIPLSQRFQPSEPDIRRMAAEPRREQVAGKERGDIITTPEGIIKQTNEVLRKKFFDGSEVSDENTSAAWDYIEQLLDTKSGAAYEFAGLINNVVDQETNSDTRMGAGLFSVSLANYAAKLAAQGNTTMISYLVRRINSMPTDNRGGTATESGRVLRGKREYSIDGYHTITTEHGSKVERTAAALFGTGKPSKEQVAAVEAAIKESEDTSIGEPGEVAGEIEKVEKRTGRKVVKKIEDQISGNIEEKRKAALEKQKTRPPTPSSVERQALSIIDQFARMQSDTLTFTEKQENQVKVIVQQDLRQRPDMKRKQPWTSQLAAKLIQAGVSEAQAETISDLVWRQHEIKAMDRELKELQTAAEKGSLAVIIQRIKDTPLEEQQKPEWMQGVIREYLVEAGLSNQAADTAARLYESVIAERFAEAKQKAFEDTLAKSAPWNNYLSRNAQLGKNALKRIQDAIRTGVLDPTQTTEGIIAKESGWSGFSKEQLTRIVQLDGVLSDDANNQVDKAEAMSELNKIIVKAKMPVRFKDAISAFYVGQALMGIPTFTVNIASPTFFAIRNFAIDVAKYAATDPKMVPVAFQSFINSFQSLYDNFMYSIKNQIYMSGEIEYMQGQNVLSELFDKGKAQWAKRDYANGMGNMLVGASQITGRILSSLDQGAIEMMQSQNITRYALEAMAGNKKIPKEKRSEIVNIVITGRRKIKEDLVASGMSPDRAGVLAELKVRSELMLSLSGFGIKEKDILDASINDALQSVGRNRAITINSLKQQQNNLRDSGIISGVFIGFLEGVAQWANKGNQSQQVFAKMLYGFALVPARVFSTALWFSPVGFVRLGVDAAMKSVGGESRYALSLATEFQQKQRFIEAIAGTALLVGLSSLLSSSTDDDEEKPFKIVVTGNGPDYNVDRQYHDSWHKNNKPGSVAIWFGKSKIDINILRGGEAISIPLIFLGALDDARIKEKLNQARKSPADLEMAADVIGSAFLALGQRGPWAAFSKPLFEAKQSDKIVPNLFGQIGYFGKTFIPIFGTSLARNISDFINDPIDKSSIQGAIYSNIPVIGPAMGTKALNAFGQPIRADDWGDKLFKLGSPLVMSFPKNTPENELNELVLKKGDGPPIPTRTNAQKKFEDPLTDKEFEIYVREYGRVVSEKMFKNRKRLESMEAKNYTKELDKYVNGYSIDGTTIPGASDMAVRAIKRSRGE